MQRTGHVDALRGEMLQEPVDRALRAGAVVAAAAHVVARALQTHAQTAC